ncbi:MAG: hypothetical protein LBU32_18840 [Clostridiales bacterium]|jgi:beta-lactamase regulating signal transducer with metallopeptidase domain|nr:hypothetical protein [Clostridiales bacterium]
MSFLIELAKASAIGAALWLLLLCLRPATERVFSQTWHYYAGLIPAAFLLGASSAAPPAAEFALGLLQRPGAPVVAASGPIMGAARAYGPAAAEFGVVAPGAAIERAGRALAESGADPEALAAIALMAWLAGAAAFLAVKCIPYARFRRRILRGARPLAASGIPARAVVSAAAATPMLMGALRPVIVLPDRRYDECELEMALSHELVHLRRGDAAVKMLLLLANALHWFNPFAYLISGCADGLCENSCDEQLARHMDAAKRRRYCGLILSTLEFGAAGRPPLSPGMCASHRNLRKRMKNMMSFKKPTRLAASLSIAPALAIWMIGGALACAAPQAPSSAGVLPGAPAQGGAQLAIVASALPDGQPDATEIASSVSQPPASATEPAIAEAPASADPADEGNAALEAQSPYKRPLTLEEFWADLDLRGGIAQSPYKLAYTLEEVRAILDLRDGSIPITNLEVPEIISGEANGIIVTDQDLSEVMETLNYIYFMPGGYAVENTVTVAIGGIAMPKDKEEIEFDTCLNEYLDYGVSFDDANKTWMFGGKPIGFLYNIAKGMMYVNLPVGVDIEDGDLLGKLGELDCAFLTVPYKRVDLIAEVYEITPEGVIRAIQLAESTDTVIIDNTSKSVLTTW